MLDANADKDADHRANKGGRPVAQPANWISGVLDCPECGGKLYLAAGLTPAVDHRTGKPRVQKPRTPKLRCGGYGKKRLTCGRFKGTSAQPVIDLITGMFASDTTDDDELDALVGERRSVKARIEGFEIIPDSFDYAPTGQTVAGMWSGDDTVKRNMVKAVEDSWGLALAGHEGQWESRSARTSGTLAALMALLTWAMACASGERQRKGKAPGAPRRSAGSFDLHP